MWAMAASATAVPQRLPAVPRWRGIQALANVLEPCPEANAMYLLAVCGVREMTEAVEDMAEGAVK
jgi:hypothetical protein